MVPLEAQRAARRKLRAAARLKPGSRLPPALFLTDPERTPDPVAVAAQLPAGWGVVYRHFGAADRFDIARALAHICRKRRLVLLIAADPALARAVRADGVHWPVRRLALARRSSVRGLQTASAHNAREIARARKAGLDAAILSAVFPSRSPSAGRAIGATRFRLAARTSGLPLYALGGVSSQTAGQVMQDTQTGIAGWAAVDSLCDAFGGSSGKTD